MGLFYRTIMTLVKKLNPVDGVNCTGIKLKNTETNQQNSIISVHNIYRPQRHTYT